MDPAEHTANCGKHCSAHSLLILVSRLQCLSRYEPVLSRREVQIIRSMPTTNSTIAALAPKCDKRMIHAESESSNGKWYAVRYQNATGYVYAPYVRILES